MELGLRSELRQILSPELMQFLKLLQLNSLELQQLIRQELEANPMLEEVEEEPEEKEQSETGATGPDTDPSGPEEPEGSLGEERINWEDFLQEGLDTGGYSQREESEEPNMMVPDTDASIEDFLLSQLRLTVTDSEAQTIGAYLIGNLDENGYLVCPTLEAAEKLQVPEERILEVLKIVQGFEPAGVGARSLQECLLLQLEREDPLDEVAVRIVKCHMEDMQKRRSQALARNLSIPMDQVQRALAHIANLQPKPGSSYSNEQIAYVFPDLIVERVDGDYIVSLNDRHIPRVRVSASYRGILGKRGSAPKADRDFVNKKLQSARLVVRMIQHRRDTLLHLMKFIVAYQREFFDRGPEHLRPLTMHQAAEEIQMHESTVSRIVHGKHCLTPQGVFKLRSFFSSKGVENSGGGNEVSNQGIRNRIARLVESEDKKNPLSDLEIGDLLRAEGFNLARRTIAQYREDQGILSARLRREIAQGKASEQEERESKGEPKGSN
jgi:RNA polymerase sigma-54 factor